MDQEDHKNTQEPSSDNNQTHATSNEQDNNEIKKDADKEITNQNEVDAVNNDMTPEPETILEETSEKIAVKATETATKAHSETQSQTKPEVVIHKSSNKLALLLSLAALLASGYLLLIDYQNKNNASAIQNNPTAAEASQKNTEIDKKIQLLTQNNTALSSQLKELKQQQATSNQRLGQQITQIKTTLDEQKTRINTPKEPNNSAIEQKFDNSQNEAALASIIQQLAQQKQNHARQITELQQNLSKPKTTPTAKEVLPETDPYDTKQAISALYAADLLVRTDRLPEAIAHLDQLLATSKLKDSTKKQINAVLTQWNKVQQPDTSQLFSKLQKLKQQINDLSLSTTENKAKDDSWYSRFISVKKIESTDTLNDSNALYLLKVQLIQHLTQAEWGLTLNQESTWHGHLTTAMVLLKDKKPQETVIYNKLKSLADSRITALLPTPSGIHDLINTLKGNR